MNQNEKRQHQRPEGRLLEHAMKGPPKISGRKLAELAELSEGRVRQIINGYRTESGMVLPIVAPAETLARLGAALELAPEDFEQAERPDVAEILRGEITSGVTEEGDLWLADEDTYRVALAEWLDGKDESKMPPRIALMLWDMDSLLDAAARKHRDEMAFLNNLITIFRRGDKPTAKQREDYELIAHDEDVSIIEEQDQMGEA